MINPRDEVRMLFIDATIGNQTISVQPVKPGCFSYDDKIDGYTRLYYFNDTKNTIKDRILMDEKVEHLLSCDNMAGFLETYMDPNAIMVMEKLVLLWEDEEGGSPARDRLEDEYGDEYAQYIAADILGQTWVERQIPVINVSSIMESCIDIHNEDFDLSFEFFFAEALLETLYHECRHLFYDCNEIIKTGDGTSYPEWGSLEDSVEDYCRDMADKNIGIFSSLLDDDVITKMRDEINGR